METTHVDMFLRKSVGGNLGIFWKQGFGKNVNTLINIQGSQTMQLKVLMPNSHDKVNTERD